VSIGGKNPNIPKGCIKLPSTLYQALRTTSSPLTGEGRDEGDVAAESVLLPKIQLIPFCCCVTLTFFLSRRGRGDLRL